MTYPFSVKKVPALPVQLAPTTIYFVKPVGGLLSLHITNTVPEVTYVATHVNDINQVVKAMLHTPNGATNPSNPVQYITRVGITVDELNLLVGHAGGLAGLDSNSKVPMAHLPTNVSAFTNDAQYQTVAQSNAAMEALIGAAPAALDTIHEIAAELQSNNSVVGSLTNSITNKASLTSNNTYSGQQEFGAAVREKKVELSTSNNIDLSLGNFYRKTITGATTLSVSNISLVPDSVTTIMLEITNGGTNVSYWANVRWAGGTKPTLTTSGKDLLGFVTYDGGSNWFGSVMGKDYK